MEATCPGHVDVVFYRKVSLGRHSHATATDAYLLCIADYIADYTFRILCYFRGALEEAVH